MGYDNPELVDILVKLFGAVIGVFFFLCFARGVANKDVKPLKVPDRFDIGHIDEPAQRVVVVQQQPKRRKKRRQPAKKAAPAPVAQTDDKLIQDCVDALVSLGTKKGEARRVAAQCLAQNPHIKTVQEFIPEVFKRGNA